MENKRIVMGSDHAGLGLKLKVKAHLEARGFEVMDVRFGGLIRRLKNCATLLLEYCDGKVARLEELEQKIVDYIDGSDTYTTGGFMENGYTDEVSVLSL